MLLIKEYILYCLHGRLSSSVREFSQNLGLTGYFISSNGALIESLSTNEAIYEKFMSKKKILEIVKVCEENSIFYNIHTSNSVITKTIEYNTLFYNYENKKRPPENKVNINIVEDIPKYIELSSDAAYFKMTIADEDTQIFSSIIRKIRRIKDIDVLNVGHISKKTIIDGTQKLDIKYNYTEITSKGTNKWNAISYLIDKLGIKPEEVIAIGDNINDKEMIENAGLGVAMANASPSIRKIADVITKDNNSDGVAEILNKYL